MPGNWHRAEVSLGATPLYPPGLRHSLVGLQAVAQMSLEHQRPHARRSSLSVLDLVIFPSPAVQQPQGVAPSEVLALAAEAAVAAPSLPSAVASAATAEGCSLQTTESRAVAAGVSESMHPPLGNWDAEPVAPPPNCCAAVPAAAPPAGPHSLARGENETGPMKVPCDELAAVGIGADPVGPPQPSDAILIVGDSARAVGPGAGATVAGISWGLNGTPLLDCGGGAPTVGDCAHPACAAAVGAWRIVAGSFVAPGPLFAIVDRKLAEVGAGRLVTYEGVMLKSCMTSGPNSSARTRSMRLRADELLAKRAFPSVMSMELGAKPPYLAAATHPRGGRTSRYSLTDSNSNFHSKTQAGVWT